MERLTYSQIKEMAIMQGIESNKRAVGRYAKRMGYKRHHTTNKNGSQYYYYIKDGDKDNINSDSL